MIRAPRYVAILIALAAVFTLSSPLVADAGSAGRERTPLDEYVAKPDPSFSFKLVKTIKGKGYTAYVLDMVSQHWLTRKEVDRPEWRHWLTIVKPDKVQTSIGFLLIGGGKNTNPAPDKADEKVAAVALQTQSVVAHLRMVPNQPLVFADDNGRKRVEDEIISYTWDKYLRTGNPVWLARLPMTKSAVRAMDAMTQFCASGAGGGVKVDRFVVAGGSKRGWTTWTTGAVDKRVVAIVPIVIDVLNLVPSFKHHYRVYGFFAPAVDDYVEMGIMDWMGTPEFARMMRIVDPYEYRSRYTMPKFLINSAGDQFFLPDSSRFYFDDLPGEKYLRYVPNTDHGLGGSDAIESLIAFYHAIITNTPRPKFSWKIEKDGTIIVETKDQPLQVRVWKAHNPKARDFRKETIGEAWTSKELKPVSKGKYVARVPVPKAGWTAFFVELKFRSGCKFPFTFTTGVSVLPDTEPYPPYKPKPIKK